MEAFEAMQICVIVSFSEEDERERLKEFLEAIRPFSHEIERCYSDTAEDFMNYLRHG